MNSQGLMRLSNQGLLNKRAGFFIAVPTVLIHGHQDWQVGDGVNSSRGVGISQATHRPLD